MARISNLLSKSIFFTFAGMIEAMAPFILIPILTRKLSVEDYGLWAIFLSATGFLCPILGMKLDDYIRTRFFKEDKKVTAQYVFAIFVLSLLLSSLVIALAYLFAPQVSSILKFPVLWIWSIVLGGWLFAMFYTMLTFHQLAGNNWYYAIIHIVQATVTLSTTIFLILSDSGWTGAIIGKLTGLSIGTALGLGLVLYHCKGHALKFNPLKLHYRSLLAFGIKYLPNGMLVVVVTLVNRLVIAHSIGLEESGLFSVASLFPMIMLIFITGFVYGWQNWCYRYFAEPNRSDLYKIVLGSAVFFIGVPVGGIIFYYLCLLVGPYVIGEKFHPALSLLPYTILAMVMQGFYLFSHTLLLYFNRINSISVIATTSLVLTVLLNIYLVESDLGAAGAAIANSIGFGLAFLLTFGLSLREIRNHYAMKGQSAHAGQ